MVTCPACFVFLTMTMGNVLTQIRKSVNNLKIFRLFLSVLPYGDKLSPLILDNVSEEYWQEWFLNGNGRIVNAAILYNLDVTYGTFEPGNGVGVYPDTGDINQEWEIVQVFMDEK